MIICIQWLYVWGVAWDINIILQKEQDNESYKARLKVAIKFFLYTSFKSEDEEVAMDSVNPKPDKQLGCLCVSIKEAFELPEMSPHGCTDATVKV